MASMDESWEILLSDLEMDDCPLFNEYHYMMNSFEEELMINGEISLQSELSLEGQSSNSNFTTQNIHVAAAGNNNTMNNSLLSEENTDFSLKQHASSESLEECTVVVPNNIPKETHEKHYDDEQSKENQEELQNRKSKRCRSSSQIQDHIIAERKRRENLTKLFIALSAVVPGLKREMDDCYLFNEYNYMNSFEEDLIINGEISLQSELSLEGQSSNSNFTTQNIHVAAADNNNTMNNSLSEENTDFSLKQHASSECLEESTVVVQNNIPKETHEKHYDDEQSKENQEELQNRKSKRCRNSSQIQDHIIAERKRRENLTKLFIALSAVVPGLKRMDKASIIKKAIDYVKCLQNRVKDLEEQSKKRKTESMVCFKDDKSNRVVAVADDPEAMKRFPNIEARVSAKDVLIIIMCEKQKDIALKLLAKLQAHNLSVVCSNVLPFGNSTLNIITIVAQVDHEELSMTMDDLVKNVIEDLLGVL
ncbi:Myc-type, basic helix-loop-helix [Sesbania bispinosa]|nr:Myc-type, basic helix-loop-helix [Sesbania bispinosa]